jgi:hypothetical protein
MFRTRVAFPKFGYELESARVTDAWIPPRGSHLIGLGSGLCQSQSSGCDTVLQLCKNMFHFLSSEFCRV